MKVKLNYSIEIPKFTTYNYRYTLELQHWDTINFELHYRNEWEDTVYSTVEEAKAAIHETAMRWGWDERKVFLKKSHGTETVVIHHRYKVKA